MQASSLPRITIKADSKLLLTYFSLKKSGFETVDDSEKVPQGGRSWVRVIDMAVKPARRMDHELVYVADLRQPQKDGTFAYVVMSRLAFEERAQNLAPRAAPGVNEPAASANQGVVLYATAWCPACKAARTWLRQKGIAFVEKDIEKDPAAAAELMSKASLAGLSTNGVPVLDVRGTLVQGFDPDRIISLLGG